MTRYLLVDTDTGEVVADISAILQRVALRQALQAAQVHRRRFVADEPEPVQLDADAEALALEIFAMAAGDGVE